MGFWNFQLLVSSSLFFSLSLSTWHCSGRLTVQTWVSPSGSGMANVTEDVEKHNIIHGLVRHFCVLLVENMTIIPSSWPALNWIISGDQEHLYSITSRHLLLSFQKPDVSYKTQICFVHRQVQPLLYSQFASKALKNPWVHQDVNEFLVSWDSAFWQLCLGWHMFLPFPSVQECVSSLPWKPPWWGVPFYSCTYPELLHKSHWRWELELSSDFITWLKKSGCKLNLHAWISARK